MAHIYKIFRFIKPYKWQLLANFLVLMVATGLALFVPRVLEDIIDLGLSAQAELSLVRSAIVLLLIGAGTAVVGFLQRYLSSWIAAHVGYDIRNHLYKHVQYLPFSYHDKVQSGQLISRGIEDVRSLEAFAGSVVVETIQLILLAISILVLMALQSPLLLVVVMIPLVPLAVIGFDFGKRIGPLFFDVDSAIGNVSAKLQENVVGVQVVKAFAREAYEISEFDKLNKVVLKLWIAVNDQRARLMPATHFLITLGTILVLWVGGGLVLDGALTVGQLVAFNAYLLLLANPVQQLTNLINSLGEASAGAQRIFEVLDHVPAILTPSDPVRVSQITGEVEFRNVSLKYENAMHESLVDISFHVHKNTKVALIGTTGSGKTSLVNLLPRFYDVSDGTVLLDGIDVRRFDLEVLRAQIGYVLQTSLLFSDTISANLALGRPETSKEEIIAAAKAAQAHDFIMQLPLGYDTVVGERGITLSGGQRQRVAIARALLIDPRILILDDSTSSVDTQTEKDIQSALDGLMAGRTTFIIAHRMATVKRADLILVMEHGKVIEYGRHVDLLADGGVYKQIYIQQLKQNETGSEV